MSLNLLKPFSDKRRELNIKPSAQELLVSIADQQLLVFKNSEVWRSFQVSTGIRPSSCLENSEGTPKGIHRIADKIGEGAGFGEVFKGRVGQGKPYWETSPEERKTNLVTSRILWLEGLEPGINQGEGCDSYRRYIYIHGTNREDKIGQPASRGCILLRNQEMVELFDAVEEGDLVYIQ